jgi:tetratricopeptide (TPR) repeat protein
MDACVLDDDTGLCGRLPLALEITAAVLSTHPALNLDKLTGEPDADHDQLEALCRTDGSSPSESSVRAALELAYRGLPTHAARVFRLLPVNPGPDASTDAIAALAAQSADQVDAALIDLTRACLLEPTPGRGARWRMNELVRRYAQRLAAAQVDAGQWDQSRDRLLCYYLNTAAAADDWLRLTAGTPLPELFTGPEEALAWLDAERGNLIAAVHLAAEAGRNRTALNLPLLMAHYLVSRRDFDDLLGITQVSLTAARRLGDQNAEGDALINLGGALLEIGQEQQAAAAHRDAAAIFRQAGNRRGEGDALNNLGVTLAAMGRPSEALVACHDAAAIFRETHDQAREGKALNNLGMALTAMGRSDEARTAHQEAAALCGESPSGTTHPRH